ncbi:hypothetical protein BHE74_00008968 [Ensete ventricosum]|nr:hypothetical protein GW17_00018647 [Ensete ventricosum]RWW82578.1 hypothetical protein BHE74_00008968 [Ensete ventricosum]RZR97762.1 hypothetical protein BHM03_00027022 [Ensete ventricosum]
MPRSHRALGAGNRDRHHPTRAPRSQSGTNGILINNANPDAGIESREREKIRVTERSEEIATGEERRFQEGNGGETEARGGRRGESALVGLMMRSTPSDRRNRRE